MSTSTFPSEIIYVRIIFPYLFGIGVSHVFELNDHLIIWLSINLLLFISALAANIWYIRIKGYRFKSQLGSLIIAFCFTFGIFHTINLTPYAHKQYFAYSKQPFLKGWISNEPQLSNGILRFEMRVVNGISVTTYRNTIGKLSIALQTDKHNPIELHYGDDILIASNYEPVEPPYNPGEFDYRQWLATKRIYHQAYLKQEQLIPLNTNSANPIIAYAIRQRKEQVNIYRKLIRNNEAFAVASTLVLGYRADLDRETLSAYSRTGTIHALSVSGMHVGIIYIFLNWALFFLNRNSLLKTIKVITISLLIWYYALLTGLAPSVLRSALMLTVFIIAKAFQQNSNSYNILSFTAFCLLLYDPLLLWDVGFQLSFLAVLGLVYLQPKIYNWYSPDHYLMDKLWSTVSLSIAAQLATFPLSIYYFHQFPIYFIFSNLFILLPLTLLMYLGIGILLLRAYFLAPIFEWIIIFTNKGLAWIAALPFSGINGIWITRSQLIILSLALGFVIAAFSRANKRLFFSAIVLFFVLQFSLVFQKLNLLQQRKILGLSLKRNFAMAFIEANSAVIVTDLKKTDKTFDFFVKPALDKFRIDKISFVRWNTDTIVGAFIQKDHQILFNHYRMLLFDTYFDDKVINGFPSYQAIWLHGNPKKDLLALRHEAAFTMVFLDASNKGYLLNKSTSTANKINIPSYVLKKNKAYLIDLTKKHEQ